MAQKQASQWIGNDDKTQKVRSIYNLIVNLGLSSSSEFLSEQELKIALHNIRIIGV